MLVYGSEMRAGGSKGKAEDREIRGLLAHHSTGLDVKMKIWLDTSPHYYRGANDCGDCVDPFIPPVCVAWPPVETPGRRTRWPCSAIRFPEIQKTGKRETNISCFLDFWSRRAYTIIKEHDTASTISMHHSRSCRDQGSGKS